MLLYFEYYAPFYFLQHRRRRWVYPVNNSGKFIKHVIIIILIVQTCSELSIVNIHANTTVSSLTASSPNTQVTPNMGSRDIAAISSFLKYIYSHVTELEQQIALVFCAAENLHQLWDTLTLYWFSKKSMRTRTLKVFLIQYMCQWATKLLIWN